MWGSFGSYAWKTCNDDFFFPFLVQNKRQEAVKTAIHCGEIAPEDDEAIIQLKKSVELPPRESMSPIPNSDDEEEIVRRKKTWKLRRS